MDALRLNKIAAALLISILLYKGIEMYAESTFEIPEMETKAYVVAGLEVEELAAAEVVAEAPAPADDIMVLLAVASPEQGKRVFRPCQTCHDANQDAGHKIGPNLYGVMGASVAQHADFSYSSALTENGGSWDFALMDAWLTKPADAIPGNRMSYGGMRKARDRAALIVYLNSQSDSPLPLPSPVSAVPTAEHEAAADIIEEIVEEATEETAEDVASEMPVSGEAVEEMIVEEETAPAAEAVDGPEDSAGENEESPSEEGADN